MVSKFNLVFTSSDVSPNIFYHKKKINKHKDIKLINDYNKILCMYELEQHIINEYNELCPSAVEEQLEYETYEFLINMYEEELASDLRGEIKDEIIEKYLTKFHHNEIRCDNCSKYTKDNNLRIVCKKYKNYCNGCWNDYMEDLKKYDKHFCEGCYKYKMDIVEYYINEDKHYCCKDCYVCVCK
jgi:hypothetical protein